MYYAEDRNKQKELWKLKQQQEAEEKRQKWIRELEARDEEEKALQEKLEKRRKRMGERALTGTGTEGVAAQARTALKGAKAAKGDAASAGDSTELSNQAVDSEKKSSNGVLGSLGGWFGRSSKAPEASTKDLDNQKGVNSKPEGN
jgi:uncharacterized protein